jgi:hypothetical protein
LIYTLDAEKPVVIPIKNERSNIVASDGYHVTKPVEVVFYPKDTCYFRVVCLVDDNKLAAGAVILVLFYLVGLTSDILILKIASFVPLLYFLYFYYVNRKEFIQIQPV